MQKFVPQCLVRIFCNECLRSTPLDPKLMFWSISFHLGAFERPFGYCTKLGAKWANLVQLKQKFVPQSLIRNSQNECSRSTYWTLSSCFHAFLSIWVHLGPFCYHAKLKAKRAILVQLMQKFVRIFTTNAPDAHHWTLNSCFCAVLSVRLHLGLFCYCTKLAAKCAKLVQLMQKFVPRCLVRIFHNERSQSTSLDPKLMFLCVSFRSHAFGTVLLLHETWCITC